MQIIPFLSWDYVHAGAIAWTDDRKPVDCDTPKGIRLAVEPARKSAPFLVPDRPWECNSQAWVQVMEDDGRYRLWYGTLGKAAGKSDCLCYAESEDGHTWEKPALGLVDWEGSTANNIVYKGRGANHFCVFKDPNAPDAARYRCMLFGAWWEGEPGVEVSDDEGMRRLKVQQAAQEGETVLPVELRGSMLGMNSPDGLRWTMLDEPILDEWHDTHNLCYYDEARGKYVAYLRGGEGGRRATSYSETDDFAHWPPSHVIDYAGVHDHPGDSIYSNGYTRYPGNTRYHLMFPAIYHQYNDSVDGQLAVSLNGRTWTRHTDRPIVERGGPGGLAEGHVYPEPSLLRFPAEGLMRLPLRVGSRFHNQWYNDTLQAAGDRVAVCWAEWKEDRLCGIRADEEGEFTVMRLTFGERLLANYRAEPGGEVRFELVDRLPWPPFRASGLEGHGFEDMTPLTGDETHAPVAWKGGGDQSVLKGRMLAVRVRLRRATLFALTLYGTGDAAVADDPRYPV